MMDLPGHANIETIDCTIKVEGRPHFVAHFIPAYQAIELEIHKPGKAEPYRTLIAWAFVKRID